MDHKFLKIEDEYFTLKGKLSAGRITAAEFEAAMKELMVEHDGRYWNIGAKTGKWHVHDGETWVEAEPPASVPAASSGSNLETKISEAVAFSEIRRFEEHRVEVLGTTREGGQVDGVAFSADGRRALAFGRLGIRVWDLEAGQDYKLVKDYYLNSAALSANGSHVLTGGTDKIVRIWDVETGREIRSFKGHDDYVTSVAFSAAGRYAFSSSDDRSIRRWNIETSQEDQRFDGHEAGITNIALVSGDRVIASMAGDRTVRSWDAQTGQEYSDRRLQLDDNYDESLAKRFAINGNRVLTCSLIQKTIEVWNLSTTTKLRELSGHTGQVWDLALSPDGTLAFTCGGSDYVEEDVKARVGLDNVVRVWSVESGAEIAKFKGHTGDVLCIAISADGKRALTGSRDKTARLWTL